MVKTPEYLKGEYSLPCIFFEKPGPHNTLRTLEITARRADELNINTIVVSSASGTTGVEALPYFKKGKRTGNRNLVIVTHSTGFLKPDFQQLLPESRKKIELEGAKILTCQHAMGGVGRAVRKKLETYQVEEIMAHTLRVFGEGTKVAVEIALMAADAGLISTLEPCLSLGGTSQGVDTAVLMRPAHAQNFFDLRILEILAKPHFIEMA
jgi:hypothetical protein